MLLILMHCTIFDFLKVRTPVLGLKECVKDLVFVNQHHMGSPPRTIMLFELLNLRAVFRPLLNLIAVVGRVQEALEAPQVVIITTEAVLKPSDLVSSLEPLPHPLDARDLPTDPRPQEVTRNLPSANSCANYANPNQLGT